MGLYIGKSKSGFNILCIGTTSDIEDENVDYPIAGITSFHSRGRFLKYTSTSIKNSSYSVDTGTGSYIGIVNNRRYLTSIPYVTTGTTAITMFKINGKFYSLSGLFTVFGVGSNGIQARITNGMIFIEQFAYSWYVRGSWNFILQNTIRAMPTVEITFLYFYYYIFPVGDIQVIGGGVNVNHPLGDIKIGSSYLRDHSFIMFNKVNDVDSEWQIEDTGEYFQLSNSVSSSASGIALNNTTVQAVAEDDTTYDIITKDIAMVSPLRFQDREYTNRTAFEIPSTHVRWQVNIELSYTEHYNYVPVYTARHGVISYYYASSRGASASIALIITDNTEVNISITQSEEMTSRHIDYGSYKEEKTFLTISNGSVTLHTEYISSDGHDPYYGSIKANAIMTSVSLIPLG